MMKKITSLLCLLSFIGIHLSAQNLQFLTVQDTNNKMTSLPIKGLKITFNDGKMQLQQNGNTTEYVWGSFSKIFFTERNITAVHSPITQQTHIAVEQGLLRVDAPKGATIQIYSLDGRKWIEVRKTTPSAITIPNTLSAGIYVIIIDGKATKLRLP